MKSLLRIRYFDQDYAGLEVAEDSIPYWKVSQILTRINADCNLIIDDIINENGYIRVDLKIEYEKYKYEILDVSSDLLEKFKSLCADHLLSVS